MYDSENGKRVRGGVVVGWFICPGLEGADASPDPCIRWDDPIVQSDSEEPAVIAIRDSPEDAQSAALHIACSAHWDRSGQDGGMQ